MVTPGGVVSPGAVEIEDGRIVAVEPGPAGAPDVTLVPGLVDLQVNGIGAVNVAAAEGDDWCTLDGHLVAQGVTAWCPTLVTARLDDYATPLTRIAEAAARPGAVPLVVGAHLEGPFLGGAPGAHRRALLQPIDEQWLAALPGVVRLVTLAPELDRARGAVRALAGRGVLVALGHSTATYEDALAAADAGARLVTHCFNGMAPLHHRQPGLVGAALSDDRLTVSVIADLVHLHPAVLALVFRAKGPDRVVLVTDAVAWEDPIEGDAPRLPDGTLAGSALTMDTAIANVVRQAGVPLAAAVRAASTTPAALVGLDDRGRLEAGCRADVVALDGDLRVTSTWIAGTQVFQR